jgi:hypothetical protein
LKKKSHMLPYLDNEFPLIARTKKKIYFTVWPLAKLGSFLLWMMVTPPKKKKESLIPYVRNY